MRIDCWQTILLKCHTLFTCNSKIKKDVAKFVVCCSCDWRFKGIRFNKLKLNLGPTFEFTHSENNDFGFNS